MRLAIITFLCATIATCWSCNTSDDSTSAPSFDRTTLLANIADRLIIDQYKQLDDHLQTLEAQAQAFTQTPNPQSLADTRQAWTAAFHQWQHCRTYTFGPGQSQTVDIARELGTFPIDPTGIENLITNMDIAFNSFATNTRGFLALEYLLYHPDNDQITIDQFANDDRATFLMALIQDIKTKVQAQHTGWIAYRDQFVNDNATDAGSSITQLFNAFNLSYEAAKNFKVGLPAGKRPGQSETAPTQVEAYYSGQSKAFIISHLQAIEAIWTGDQANQQGIGFQEYIASAPGGPELVTNTLQSWANIKDQANALPDIPLSEALTNDPTTADALHEAMNDHTRYFKSDISSLLGLYITYDSGDGD